MRLKPLVTKTGGIQQLQPPDSLDFGRLNLGPAEPLTIVAGAITITRSFHKVDTQFGASSDDLDFILGGNEGDVLILRPTNSSHDVKLRDGVGNLKLDSTYTMTTDTDTITLIYNGLFWLEVARSKNG